MNKSLSTLDPDGLIEYSVVFTDRSLNHMSQRFQATMRDISSTLKDVYNAHSVVLVPGGGTYGMEAVARQFATGKKCLVVRNGWFSYRWSQLFEVGRIPEAVSVLKARPVAEGRQAPFAPTPVEEVVAAIETEKPDIVFAPHVETASGIILPQDYLEKLAAAVHKVGGLFVLDCVASGAIWVDMQNTGVDVLISAPQKTWSSSPCAGLIMLSEVAQKRLETTQSSSFSLDLNKWRNIMAAYENGHHAYYATLPTDALVQLHANMLETRDMGFENAREAQQQLGDKVRASLARHGFNSVAAEGFGAPGVVVHYTDSDAIHDGSAFAAQNMQVAAGVPLACDEPEDFKTFRLGLFGLDKLGDVDAATARLEDALKAHHHP